MALILEAYSLTYLDDGEISFGKQLLGPLYPFAKEVPMRGNSSALFEHP
jgi:hypothetical protein